MGNYPIMRILLKLIFYRIDLDIEGGSNAGYTAFVNQLRTHFNGASKQYVVYEHKYELHFEIDYFLDTISVGLSPLPPSDLLSLISPYP